jgi:hypothetical protein
MLCIFCKPMNIFMRPYRRLSAYIISLPYHRKAFRLVAKIGPVTWLISLPILTLIVSSCVESYVTNASAQLILGAVAIPFFLWLTLFWFVAPDPDNPGILFNLKPGGILSAHLEGDMSSIDLDKGAYSAIALAREIGFHQIDLYSPLFGLGEKEKVWLRWLQRRIESLAPGAAVEVVHRRPMNRYVSFAYSCQYGKNARGKMKNGRIDAACLRITGI